MSEKQKLAFIFPSEEERKDFAKQKPNPLASAINVGIEKDSIESFYLFKLKLKKEDSRSSASSSQKCKHFCELLLEGESNFFERGETQGFCEAKFDFLASAKFTKNRTLLVPP